MQFLNIHKHDPDTNRRIVLHVAIQMNPKTVMNIVLVHLSYQRPQQCKNMAEILAFIAGSISSCISLCIDWKFINTCILEYLLAHLSRRLTGELIGYPWIRRPSVIRPSVRPSSVVRPQFQTSSPLKPLGQSKPNFMWSLTGKGERKFI